MPLAFEVIEIGSDSPQPSPRQPLTKSTSWTEPGVFFQSDDFDSTIDIQDKCGNKPAKRRRLSPILLDDEDAEVLPRAETVAAQQGSRTTVKITKAVLPNAGTSRFETRLDDLDSIVFNSSPLRASKSTRPTISTHRPLSPSPLPDELSDGSSLEDLGLIPHDHPKANTQLSSRTVALLANLGRKNFASERKRNSAIDPTGQNTSSKLPGSGLAKPKLVEKPVACEEELREPTKPTRKSAKGILTAAEEDARALERERSKASEKARKAKQKEEEKETKQRLKDQKAREKQKAAALAEVNKSKLDKKGSTPEMIVDLPSTLDGTAFGDQIKAFLDGLQVQSTFFDSPVPTVIKWRRKISAVYNTDLDMWEPVRARIEKDKHVMCLLSAKEFVDMVQVDSATVDGQDLNAHVLKFKSSFEGCTPIYLIEGLTAWMRKNKNVRNRAYQAAVLGQIGQGDGIPTSGQPSRSKRKKPAQEYVDEDMIEDALLRLQVIHKCFIHHTAAPVESAEWIANFTQHISTIPYKQQRMNLDTTFCMDVGQVKTGDDKDDTYVKMLQEIVRITAPIAYGIASEYPNVVALTRGFRENGPLALQDLMKCANRNGAFANNRIGPAISKRVYNIFMGTDPASNDV